MIPGWKEWNRVRSHGLVPLVSAACIHPHPIKVYLKMLRFHRMLRANESFHIEKNHLMELKAKEAKDKKSLTVAEQAELKSLRARK